MPQRASASHEAARAVFFFVEILVGMAAVTLKRKPFTPWRDFKLFGSNQGKVRNGSETSTMMMRMSLDRFVMATALFLAGLTLASPARAQYGPIDDLKIAKPSDRQDAESTPPPEGAIVLFDGENLDAWSLVSSQDAAPWKLVEGDAMQVQGGGIRTRETFGGHFRLHVEFRVPYQPEKQGQARGNSGVYLQGRYEVQILDSYGLDSRADDCGAIYEVAPPRVNACKAPTVWQAYDIEFWAPICEDGRKVEPARITVHQNGVLIHDRLPIPVDNTRAGLGGEPCEPGPIHLQDHGDPVQFRNIWLLPL